ncbi:MAG: glycosyltransferase [Actinomycetota bacterium]|nr:glycosyltransferase [Actinomycetota bacterium]
MEFKDLLILTPEFPDEYNKRIGGIFVKEQVKYLKDYFENVYVVSPTSVWREYLLNDHLENYGWDNVQVYHPLYVNFPFPYVGKYLKRFWIYLEKRAILKLIKTEKIDFDLIHAHYTWPSGAIAVEPKKEFKVPAIITEHTSITLHKALKRKDPYYLQTWDRCDAIIRVNKKDVPLFKKFNKNTVNIPNGFDEEKFCGMDRSKCREKLNLPLDKKIILSIGSLIEVKGHKYSIEAMNEILKKREDILYIIGGSGPLKEDLQLDFRR